MNDLKYTDRDVREMPNARELVENYLEDYSGGFDFLIDCRMRLAQGSELSVGMVRGVLNCMRNDPRVSGLPEPSAEIIPISGRKKNKEDNWWEGNNSHCGNEESHEGHSFDQKKKGKKKSGWCVGTPFEINRDYVVWMPAKVKAPYALAKYARAMIHRVAPEGDHYTQWNLPYHGATTHEYGERECTEVSVKLMCRYPSILRNPILIDAKDVDAFVRGDLLEEGKRMDPLPLCVHCETIDYQERRNG